MINLSPLPLGIDSLGVAAAIGQLVQKNWKVGAALVASAGLLLFT
jgi:hypothetical protein